MIGRPDLSLIGVCQILRFRALFTSPISQISEISGQISEISGQISGIFRISSVFQCFLNYKCFKGFGASELPKPFKTLEIPEIPEVVIQKTSKNTRDS